MTNDVPLYLEVGKRRVFAAALEWPGWCRGGRDEDSALEALVAYGPRYGRAVARAREGFAAPADPSVLRVVERLEGDGTTDFGAPGKAPKGDGRPLDEAEAKRQVALLRACWAAFDRSAEAAKGAELRKGPRGGGRELDAILEHVLGADEAYLSRLGGGYDGPRGADVADRMAGVRKAFADTVSARARGEPPPRAGRKKLWTPRYSVRRSAWHALDHAWEIEDRAT